METHFKNGVIYFLRKVDLTTELIQSILIKLQSYLIVSLVDYKFGSIVVLIIKVMKI